jgi:hypothetical protein
MQSARFGFWGLATILSLLLCGGVNIVVVQNLRIPNIISNWTETRIAVNLHHNFPGVNGKICVVERPIELLFCDWLVGRVVVGCEVWMGESLLCLYTLLRVEDEHAF